MTATPSFRQRMRLTTPALLIIALVAGLTAPTLRAQSAWNGGNGNWNTATQWTPNGVPNSTTAIANFSVVNGVASSVSLASGPFAVNQLNLNNAVSGTFAFQSGTLIFDGTNPLIKMEADDSSSTATLTSTGTFQWNKTTTVNTPFASTVLTIQGQVTNGGIGLLTKTGLGTLTFDGSTGFGTATIIYSTVDGGLLKILTGGKVSNARGFIGNASGSTGTVTVDGTGSVWTNSGNLGVGISGTGTLNIQNGGTVSNTLGYFGYSSGSSGTATVDGAGSTWANSGDFYVGFSGNGTLNIKNGGTVSNAAGFIGYNSGSTGTVTVDGTGSNWTNSDTLFVGYSGMGNVNPFIGGLVVVNVGTLVVNNAGSTLTAINLPVVGAASPTSTGALEVRDGGTVTAAYGRIGGGGAGTVTVKGAGASLTITNYLKVGSSTTGILKIENGGKVSNLDSYMGESSGAVGTATVTGAGSIWSTGTDLYVGVSGNGTLKILDGGVVTSITGVIGSNPASPASYAYYTGVTLNLTGGNPFGNPSSYIPASDAGIGVVFVNGAGSTWTDSGALTVGRGGIGGLDIEDGGKVTSASGVLGESVGSAGFTKVSGTNSQWANSGNLFVGNSGTGTLSINNGGTVSNSFGVIGYVSGATGTVTVDGTGSKWTNTDLFVGRLGTGTLNITGGGAVSSVNGVIGYVSGATGTVTVDGTGSKWTNSSFLEVGVGGTGTLSITGGGKVSNTGGIIGYSSGSTGSVTVDGTGSTWTNSSNLYVGNSGTGTLNVTGGAKVSNDFGLIGEGTHSKGTVTVDGTGSIWTNSNDLFVGDFGTGTLSIKNGGTVSAPIVEIGSSAGSVGLVTLDGAASSFLVSGALTVGNLGSGTLNIQNGAVFTHTITNNSLGFNAGSSGILAVLNGATWNNSTLPAGPYNPLFIGGGSGGPAGTGLLRIANGTVNTGAVTVWSTGTLEVGGSAALNTPSLTFNGGTLRTLSNVTFPNNATLAVGGAIVDSNGFDSTLSGVLSGPGALTKVGLGSLTLTAINTYTGNTNINAGTLYVDGSLASHTVNVNFGGFLGGTGILLGNVFNNGIVSPGHPSGTLTIKGNYTQGGGGTLVIKVFNAHTFDRLLVGGSASLAGTLRVVNTGSYQPMPGDRLVFLKADGGVSGTFSTVNNDLGPQPGRLVWLDVVYEANDVALVGVQNSFVNALGITPLKDKPAGPINGLNFQSIFKEISPNQIAVALAIDSALTDSRLAKTLAFLNALPFEPVPHQLDKISPEELTSIYTLGFSETNTFVLNVDNRLADFRQTQSQSGGQGDSGKTLVQDKNDPRVINAVESRWGTYFNATGDSASTGDTANASGYHTRSFGANLGTDVKLTDHFMMGLSLQYSHSDNDLTDGGKLNADGGKVALYGMYHASSGFFAQGQVGGGLSNYSTRRSALEGDAFGNTNGAQFDAAASLGWDLNMGKFTLTPMLGMTYTRVGLDAYDEHGSLLPLHIDQQEADSTRGRVGLRAAYTTHVGKVLLTPSVGLQWQHEFGDQDLGLTSSFANGAGSPFSVNGPVIGRDSSLVNASLSAQWSRYAAYVVYQGDLVRQNYQNNTVLVGFRVAY